MLHSFDQLPIFKVSGSGVADTDALAAGFTIGQNMPNPARSRVSIPVAGVKGGMNARFSLYTVEGRELLAQPVNPGQTSVEVDVSKLPSGTYVYALTSGPLRRTRQMVVAR